MTAKDAIGAHVNWKLRIHALLSGRLSEQLDPAAIARDDGCELGQWIRGEGRGHADLSSAHAEFHKEAARIIREHYSGRKIGLEAISPDSAFGKLTTRIVGMLTKIETR